MIEDFSFWYKKICDQEILKQALSEKIMLNNSPLTWEVCYEILSLCKFDPKYTSDMLVEMSNSKYAKLDQMWIGVDQNDENEINDFYKKTFNIIPWGHGIFTFDHNVDGRRESYMNNVRILTHLLNMGSKSLLDYGAGGGQFSLLAKAIGFEKVAHHEFKIFHPYVDWRQKKITSNCQFILSDAEFRLNLNEKFDCVVCCDVAEHVFDVNNLLIDINKHLKIGGKMAWVSVFGEGISCHLHKEYKGKEENLLNNYGFTRISNLPNPHFGHSGIYEKGKEI